MGRIATALLGCLIGASASAQESNFSSRIEAALQAEIRTEAERDRDRNRRPVETLAFFGLREDMRVIELLPGGGWYTKLLAPALADSGKLYVAINTNTVVERVLGQPGFEQVEVLVADLAMERREGVRGRDVPPFSFGVTDIDAVLTFRNLHNMTPEGRASVGRAVFAALKPGGVYGVVDHQRRHMEPDNPENGRRLDPVLVIQEHLALGFEFEAFSDLHYRPDDEMRYEVGRATVTGNTNRFTMLFRKPE